MGINFSMIGLKNNHITYLKLYDGKKKKKKGKREFFAVIFQRVGSVNSKGEE